MVDKRKTPNGQKDCWDMKPFQERYKNEEAKYP